MHKKIFFVATFAAMAAVASCTPQKSAQSCEETKSLVLYYSQTGATRAVAEELKALTGADIDSIVVENPYRGSFEETIQRCQQEMQSDILPALKPMNADIANYDTIYLGYPVWFGTFARPMLAYLSSAKLEGKVIIPFCTFGSGGLMETTAALKNMHPAATVLGGYGVRNARIDAMPEELDRFLKENHYIAGDIEPLPAYGEQYPVTDEEKRIFDEACGNYPFPLGTPITAASRQTDKGTDYIFQSRLSYGTDDPASVFTIFITAPANESPFFTRVDR